MNSVKSNVFDPIQPNLDQVIFNGTDLRPSVNKFVQKIYYHALNRKLGVTGRDWAHLYLTGSLTTYQYSATSDADHSVFPDYDRIWKHLNIDPHDARVMLVEMSIDYLDGIFIPGTLHPIQFFVESPGVVPTDKFRPGLRSAYDLLDREWFVKPEKERAHSVQDEWPDVYERASEIADKMTTMLDSGNYDAAQNLWITVHKKRQLDQQADLGDFSEGNITLKLLLNRGLIDRLRNEVGLKIQTKVGTLYNPLDSNRFKAVFAFGYDPESDTLVADRTHYSVVKELIGKLGAPKEDTRGFAMRIKPVLGWVYQDYNTGDHAPDWKVEFASDLYDQQAGWSEARNQQALEALQRENPNANITYAGQSDYKNPDDTYEYHEATLHTSMPPCWQAPQFFEDYQKSYTPEVGETTEVRGYDWEVDYARLFKLIHMKTWPLKNIDVRLLTPEHKDWNQIYGYYENGKIWIHPFLTAAEASETLWHEIQHQYQDQEKRRQYYNYNVPRRNFDYDVSEEEHDPSQYEEHPDEIDANMFAQFMNMGEQASTFLVVPMPPKYDPTWVPRELHLDRGEWDEQNELYALTPEQLKSEEDAQVKLFRTDYSFWQETWVSEENFRWSIVAALPELWEDRVTTKVIWDWDKDRIILGTMASLPQLPNSKIVGEYHDGRVTLFEAEKQWISPVYFRRLWHSSYPDKELKDVYFRRGTGDEYKLRSLPRKRNV